MAEGSASSVPLLRRPRAFGRRGRILLRFLGRLSLTALLLPAASCSVLSRGFLAPVGQVAGAERHEFLLVCLILLFVIGPVLLLTPVVAWHYRLSNSGHAFRPQWGFSWVLEFLIWIPPTGIVILLGVLLWQNTERLDPYRPLSSAPPVEVDVVALDWKWLFIYPAQHIASVNRLVVPMDTPIRLRLTSGTVMQSFFIPKVAGQIYAMAGMITQLNLSLSQPGTFRGENTQFNGDGFQSQKFDLISVAPSDFASWTEHMQTDPGRLDDKAYEALSRQSVLPQPIGFGQSKPGIFMSIVMQRETPGYLKQHQEAAVHG